MMKSMSIRQDDEEEYKLKIILAGLSGVGKTNIRERFCQNKFDPFSAPTVGVQMSFRKFISPFEEKPRKFVTCFWDVVGEINSKELSPAFFKNIIGVVYVFDLTSRNSLSSLCEWVSRVEQYNLNRVIPILIGNKKDLKEFREVPEREIMQFRKHYDIDFYREVSALDPYGGVNQCLHDYLKTIQKEFDFGLKKPLKLRKPEAYHRSCI